VPTETATELTRLRPKRIVVLGGPAAISDGVVSALGSFSSSVVRIAGADRFETAADVSAATYAPGANVAYIATGTNFPDALAGASIAAQSGKGLGSTANAGPVLLTMPDSIPASIQAELQRLKPQRIVILGGTTAVSSTVAASLEQYATTGSVTRLSGADRFATAAAVSQKYFASSSVVFLATGTDFADALAGAPMVGWNGYPILLVTNDSVPAATAAEIKRLNPSRIVILGGTSAVSAAVQAAL
jgi:putative cell wall-binding protein